MVGTPFHHKTAIQNQRLFNGDPECMDTRDVSVGHWQCCGPLVTRDAGAGGQGHKAIIPLGIARGVKRNSAQRACARGVGRRVVLKYLHVRTKFELHGIIIRRQVTVTMVAGLRLLEMPFLQGKWLRHRIMTATM
jgi:hypothetical protein